VQYIDVRDLAAWVIQVIEKRVVGVYNALGPAQRLEMSGLLAGIKQAIPSSDARFTWVPTDFLDKQGVSPWSDMPVWFPPIGEESGAGTMSNARAVSRGLTFRPIAETTTATLEWVQSLDAEEREKATRGAGIAAAREAEVLRKWHARARKAGTAPRP
jgi:2'-hydroxyisoflavone reductase